MMMDKNMTGWIPNSLNYPETHEPMKIEGCAFLTVDVANLVQFAR